MATRSAPPKRRKKGTGSVYQRRDGLFIGEITIDGERRTVSGYGYDEVDQKLADLLKGASWTGSTGELGDYLQTWLAKIARSKEVTERTQMGYESIIRNYIVPRIGKTRLSDLSVPQVQRMLDGLDLHANTRRNVRACLSSALNDAVRQGLIPINVASPTRVKGAVKAGRTPGAVVSIDQKRLEKVAAALEGGGVVTRVIDLIMHTGVRRQDALALDWRDVDFDRSVIRFHRALKKGRDGYYIGEPKTTHGNREIPMSRDLWLKMALWRSMDAGEGELPTSGPVFRSPKPKSPGDVPHPDWVTHQFQKMLAAAGLPKMRVHDLRHAFASILLSRGVDYVRVARIMGHTPDVLMRIYAHVSAPHDQEIVAEIDYDPMVVDKAADEAYREQERRLLDGVKRLRPVPGPHKV